MRHVNEIEEEITYKKIPKTTDRVMLELLLNIRQLLFMSPQERSGLNTEIERVYNVKLQKELNK